VGSYSVNFTASDGTLSDSETVEITVEDTTAPTDTPTPGPADTPAPTPEPVSVPTPPAQFTGGGGTGNGGGGGGLLVYSANENTGNSGESSLAGEDQGSEPQELTGAIKSESLVSPSTGTQLPGSEPAGQVDTVAQPATEGEKNILPPVGLNSVFLLGGTISMNTAVKRYGSARDYDIMLKTLIKGIGVFTAVILGWLVINILHLL
jgi:hypothetical protein